MLTTVLPLKAEEGSIAAATMALVGALAGVFAPGRDLGTPDLRPSLGIHFVATYVVPPSAPLNRPHFGITVIFDNDFFLYLASFTGHKPVAASFDAILMQMDESGIVPPTEKSSAVSILSHGGSYKRSLEFARLLNRYNYTRQDLENKTCVVASTFPGLTARAIVTNYPNALTLWPAKPTAQA
jgi:hypothetical protein